MSLPQLLSALVEHLHSPEFHPLARHADHPRAFTRRRKLPLAFLIALMLSGMGKSVQAELSVNTLNPSGLDGPAAVTAAAPSWARSLR